MAARWPECYCRWALIIIPPTLFSPGVADPFQNMVLRAQTHIDLPALGGFVIKAGVIQDAQFTDLLTRLRLSCQSLGLFGFGRDQFGQGGVDPGCESRWSAARIEDLRVIRPLRSARRVHRHLGGHHRRIGLSNLPVQVQTGPLGHFMLTMEEAWGMLGAEVLLLVVSQHLGFVTGVLDHGHR